MSVHLTTVSVHGRMDGAVTDIPIACTLTGSSFEARLNEIGRLLRDGLRRFERRELTLDLRFTPDVVDRVRELVRQEQACCGFLSFVLHESPDEVQLTITAPPNARAVADDLFDQFLPQVR